MRKVEKAREIRLWLVQVVAPLTIGGVILWNNCPNLRWSVQTNLSKTKQNIKRLFKKKENGVN